MYPTSTPGSDASFVQSSRVWTDIFDMLRWWRRERDKRGSTKRRGTVWIRNNTARDVDAGEILQLQSLSSVSDSTQTLTGMRSPVMRAGIPTWHTGIDRLIVCENPVPAGELFPYSFNPWAAVQVTGEDGTNGSYVMPDPDATTTGRISRSGIWRVLGYDSSNGFAIVELGQNQPRWRYTLTQDSQSPSTTTATLKTLDDVSFGDINLSDPDGVGDDDPVDYTGYCVQCGNEFHIATGPC